MTRHFSKAVRRAAAVSLGLSLAAWTARLAAAECNQKEVSDAGTRGAAMFTDGLYQEAIDAFVALEPCSKDPALPFNIARSHEQLGKLAETDAEAKKPGSRERRVALERAKEQFARASSRFATYLERVPNAEDAPVVRERIGKLEEKVRRLAQELAALDRERPEPGPSKPPAPPRETPSAAPWVIAGVGSAVLVAGLVVGLVAASRHDDAEQGKAVGMTAREALDLDESARQLATVANVQFAIGGAATLAGGIWGIIDLVQVGRADASNAPGTGRGAFFSLGFAL